MRLWTLHPRYLDPQGLVALWREALLAQKVLAGGTRGYRHHPQLERFRSAADPMAAIGSYLMGVHAEATRRGYNFDESLVSVRGGGPRIPATAGQLELEARHLRDKLTRRSPHLVQAIDRHRLRPHPLFRIVPGPPEAWEKAGSPGGDDAR